MNKEPCTGEKRHSQSLRLLNQISLSAIGKFPIFEDKRDPRGTTILISANNVGHMPEYDMEKPFWDVSGRFCSSKITSHPYSCKQRQ